jgi:hypothetical protein
VNTNDVHSKLQQTGNYKMHKTLTIAGAAVLFAGFFFLLLRILPGRLFIHRIEDLFGFVLLIVGIVLTVLGLVLKPSKQGDSDNFKMGY